MYVGLRMKFHVFFSDFNETWIFSTHLRKKIPPISKFVKILSVGAETFHGRTGRRAKLMVGFRNFTNAPKNNKFSPRSVFMSFLPISQHSRFPYAALIGFCNRDGVCLLHSTHWVFKYNSRKFSSLKCNLFLCWHLYHGLLVPPLTLQTPS
jgi:hypothetical protein